MPAHSLLNRRGLTNAVRKTPWFESEPQLRDLTMSQVKNSPQRKLIKKKPYSGKMLKRSLSSNAAICKANNKTKRKQPHKTTPTSRAHKTNVLPRAQKISADQKLRRVEAFAGALNVVTSWFVS